MTYLRKRMIEDLQMKDLSESTIESYVRSVSLLSKHYGKSPDKLTEDDLRDYFLYMVNEKGYEPSTISSVLAGIRFFYRHTLKQDRGVLSEFRIKGSKKLPVVLSREEVQLLLETTKYPPYRAYFTLIYNCGLRLAEGLRLQTRDVDKERMQVFVRGGKGKKDRYVPLPGSTLRMLREFWLTHRNPKWLFPATKKQQDQTGTMSRDAVQIAFKRVLENTDIKKRPVSIHSLRHAYATHLLEAGVSLYVIQECLGHSLRFCQEQKSPLLGKNQLF